MSERLPSFQKDKASPPLPEASAAIALSLEGTGLHDVTLAHGSYRVSGAERAHLGGGPVRTQVWLLVIHRDSRTSWLGRPGKYAIVTADDEPAEGDVTGWFSVRLAECCGLPADVTGLVDVTAVLGPWKSAPLEIRLRA